MRIFKAILAQLSFFTIIPAVQVPLEDVADLSFTSPLIVGGITGILDFSFLLGMIKILGKFAVILLIPFVEVIRGFHHLDGLLDYGDAIMVKDYDKRIRVLHDVNTGSGAIGLLLVYIFVFVVAVLNLRISFLTLISAEVLSRASALTLLSVMKPIEGSFLAKVFYSRLKKWWKITFIQVEVLLFSTVPLIITYVLLTAFFFILGEKTLRGSSGDYIGFIITLSFPLYLLVADRYCYQYSILQLLLTLH